MHWSGTGSGLGGLEAGPRGMRFPSSSLKLSSTFAFRTRGTLIGLDFDLSSSSGSSSSNLWLSSGPPRIFLAPHLGTVFTSIFLSKFFVYKIITTLGITVHFKKSFNIKWFLFSKICFKNCYFFQKNTWGSFLFVSRSFLLSTKCLTIKLNWFCCRQSNMLGVGWNNSFEFSKYKSTNQSFVSWTEFLHL